VVLEVHAHEKRKSDAEDVPRGAAELDVLVADRKTGRDVGAVVRHRRAKDLHFAVERAAE
jgi:hypothetical protein